MPRLVTSYKVFILTPYFISLNLHSLTGFEFILYFAYFAFNVVCTFQHLFTTFFPSSVLSQRTCTTRTYIFSRDYKSEIFSTEEASWRMNSISCSGNCWSATIRCDYLNLTRFNANVYNALHSQKRAYFHKWISFKCYFKHFLLAPHRWRQNSHWKYNCQDNLSFIFRVIFFIWYSFITYYTLHNTHRY